METKSIPISRIIVPTKRFRDYDESQAGFVLESIKREGLRTPITVRLAKKTSRGLQYKLVAGNYRLQAMRLLGASLIPAIIIEKENSKRWELIENLGRVELTHLQKAEHLVKYICLVEGCDQADLTGAEFKISGASRKLKLPGLTAEACRKTLERAIAIASIRRKAKKMVREAGLDNHQAHLLTVAKEPTLEDQLQKIDELRKGAGRPKVSTGHVEKGNSRAARPVRLKKRRLRLVKTFDQIERKMKGGGIIFLTGGDILVKRPVAS